MLFNTVSGLPVVPLPMPIELKPFLILSYITLEEICIAWPLTPSIVQLLMSIVKAPFIRLSKVTPYISHTPVLAFLSARPPPPHGRRNICLLGSAGSISSRTVPSSGEYTGSVILPSRRRRYRKLEPRTIPHHPQRR